MYKSEKSCFFTGHRQIASAKIEPLQVLIKKSINALIERGVTTFIGGGAYGFDYLCSTTIIDLKNEKPEYANQLKLLLYLPCLDQSKNWSYEEKFRLEYLKSSADSIKHITKSNYTTDCMKKRNYAMVDDALFGISFCLYNRSGTHQTIRYAQLKNREIINLADELYSN